MERSRQIVAVIVGILVIIALVLIAKWTGDQIREKFFAAKKTPVVTQPVESVKPVVPAEPAVVSVATPSAIPATGPNDWVYVASVTVAVLGLSFLRLARDPLRTDFSC